MNDTGTDTSISVPQRLAATLRQEIRGHLQAGEKLPGMHVLRRRFGVSINTIGAALDILAGEGLVEKRRGSGVYVAQRAGRRQIGVLSELDLFDPRIGPHFRAVASALRTRLQQLGAEPQLYMGHAEPGPGVADAPTCPRFWADVATGRLDGAVILNTPATDAWYFRIQGCPIPLVGALTGYDAKVDFEGLAAAAVKRLAQLGCRRLGLIAAPGVAAFRQAVSACGLATCDAWIAHDLDPAVRGAGLEAFRRVWTAPDGRPDGLVVLDDMLFADAQWAILERGVRIPQELRLVVQTSQGASPPIRLPVIALAIAATEYADIVADMLMKRLRGEALVPVTQLLSFREVAVPLVAPLAPELSPSLVADARPSRQATSQPGDVRCVEVSSP